MNCSRYLKFAVGLDSSRSALYYATKDGAKYISRRDAKFADVIAHAVGVPFELVPSIDGETGRHLPNGNWTGLMGMVLRGEVDLATCMSATTYRNQVVDFSYPLYMEQITFVTSKPDFLPKIYALLDPFSKELWLIFLATLVIMSVVVYVFLRRKYTYQFVLINMLKNLLDQSSNLKLDKLSEQLLLLTWIIGVMSVSSCYSAVLLSFLSFPSRGAGVQDISDLSRAVAKGTHECATYPGSYFPNFLLSSEDELKIIGHSSKKNMKSRDILKTMQQSKKKIAFIGLRSDFLMLDNDYFISENIFCGTMPVSAFRKDFPCKSSLNTAILKISSTGLFQKILKDTAFLNNIHQLLHAQVDDIKKILSLSDISGAFAMLLIGYMLSCLTFMIEILSHKCCKDPTQILKVSMIFK